MTLISLFLRGDFPFCSSYHEMAGIPETAVFHKVDWREGDRYSRPTAVSGLATVSAYSSGLKSLI